MSSTESENPGAPFKVTREKLGLSIHDVSIATKINPRILKALEDGDRTSLPPHSFARGFIRSYAAYLKIEAKPILDAYNLTDFTSVNLNPSTNSESTKMEAGEVETQNDRTQVKIGVLHDPTLKSKLYISMGLVALVVVIFGVRQIFDKYAQERVVEPHEITKGLSDDATNEENASDNQSAAQTDDASNSKAVDPSPSQEQPTALKDAKEGEVSSVIGGGKPSDKVAPPSSPAPSAPSATSSQDNANPVKASDTQSKPVATADTAAKPTPQVSEIKPQEQKPDQKAKEITATVATPVAAPKPTEPLAKPQVTGADSTQTVNATAKPAPPATKTNPQEVIIEALDRVEITVTVDGGSPQKYSLTPESVHTIKAKSSAVVDVADGGMVNIIHNGRERGVPGDLGKPAKIKFP